MGPQISMVLRFKLLTERDTSTRFNIRITNIQFKKMRARLITYSYYVDLIFKGKGSCYSLDLLKSDSSQGRFSL